MGEADDGVKLSHFFLGDFSKELSGSVGINSTEAVLILNRVSVASEDILEEASDALSGCVLVDFKMIEVFSGSGIPLVEIAILVLNGALRSHTHL